MRFLLTALALLALLAAPAAASTWTGTAVFKSGETATFDFLNADAATGDSDGFKVDEGHLLVCFDPDTGSTTVGGGTITVRKCLNGPKPASNPTFECVDTGTLDGTEGAAASQTACELYGPGWYYIDILTACTSDDCRVTFQHYLVR